MPLYGIAAIERPKPVIAAQLGRNQMRPACGSGGRGDQLANMALEPGCGLGCGCGCGCGWGGRKRGDGGGKIHGTLSGGNRKSAREPKGVAARNENGQAGLPGSWRAYSWCG
jgi:hypothetical protein